VFWKIIALAACVVLVWSATARSSQAHGPRQVVTVQPYQTLWTIAQAHTGGDVRAEIWRIEQANHLAGSEITPGQRLILP
jgi:predicted Zn-dependent protease